MTTTRSPMFRIIDVRYHSDGSTTTATTLVTASSHGAALDEYLPLADLEGHALDPRDDVIVWRNPISQVIERECVAEEM